MYIFALVNFSMCLLAMLPMAAQAQQGDKRTTTLREPIAAILDAFRTHQIVALGEGNHGNEQGHAFRLELIRDPRFAALVDDIVVEVGNSLYQTMMDDFVNGEDIPSCELRKVWENSTQAHGVSDVAIYAEFFRAVRSLNVSRPPEHRLRVLLGAPPIDWDEVLKGEDEDAYGGPVAARDGFPAELIQREVLAKGRRALVVYGDIHLRRRNSFLPPVQNAPMSEGWLVQILNRNSDVNLFSITTSVGRDLTDVDPSAAEWPTPTLALLAGTELGATPFKNYEPSGSTVFFRDGKVYWLEEDPSIRLQDQFDALLYLGPPGSITYSQIPAERCADPAYIQKRIERIEYVTSRMGFGGVRIGPDPVTKFKERCAKILQEAVSNLLE